MFIHFNFRDGSNPYIATGYTALFFMITHYNLRHIWDNSYMVESERSKPTYDETKDILRDFAMTWQERFVKKSWTWGEIADYEGFFRKYGKKHGLLREFRENGIC